MQNFFQKIAHNSMFDRNITAIGIIAAVAGRNGVFPLKNLSAHLQLENISNHKQQNVSRDAGNEGCGHPA